MSRSIRRSLLGWLVPAFVVMLGIGALAAYYVSLLPALDAYDQALTDDALALSASVRVVNGRPALELAPQADQLLRTEAYDRVYYALRGPDGRRVAGDPIPPPPNMPSDGGRVVYEDRLGDEPVRVVGLVAACGEATCLVQVAETMTKRDRLRGKILLGILAPGVGVAAVTLLLIWFGVGRGLAPLTRLSNEIRARAHGDLHALDENAAPSEAHALVSAINRLLADLEVTSTARRRFLADAAHQLRTPLAGIQTQAELALQQADPEQLRRTLQRLHQATLRTARLANQLLVLARAEPGAHRFDPAATCELRQVIESNADDWVHRALGKELDLGIEVQPARVKVDALLIANLVGNLVDNAIEYTPRGGRITLRCRAERGWVRLEVEDNGPGIPAEERRRVFERFHRSPGTPGAGSGLGLAIVSEIAQAHGASVEITEPAAGTGTLVIVRLPAANERVIERRTAEV
jgi:two-component system, OmpR family, sensor histidine kinase TctE